MKTCHPHSLHWARPILTINRKRCVMWAWQSCLAVQLLLPAWSSHYLNRIIAKLLNLSASCHLPVAPELDCILALVHRPAGGLLPISPRLRMNLYDDIMLKYS